MRRRQDQQGGCEKPEARGSIGRHRHLPSSLTVAYSSSGRAPRPLATRQVGATGMPVWGCRRRCVHITARASTALADAGATMPTCRHVSGCRQAAQALGGGGNLLRPALRAATAKPAIRTGKRSPPSRGRTLCRLRPLSRRRRARRLSARAAREQLSTRSPHGAPPAWIPSAPRSDRGYEKLGRWLS